MASRIGDQVRLMLRACANDDEEAIKMDDVQLPDQTTYRRWRYGMGHLCLVQIGMLLTRSHEDKKQIIIGDGTPVNGRHVENFTIKSTTGNVYMIPWVQAGKGSKLSATNYAVRLKESQMAYNSFYSSCKDKTGLPDPIEIGSFIFNIAAACNDHASNETARNREFNSIKKKITEDLGNHVSETDEALQQFYCSHHKLMLWAKAIRKADHDFVTEGLPDRDKEIREFRTSNVLDMMQLQVHNMFGHRDDI